MELGPMNIRSGGFYFLIFLLLIVVAEALWLLFVRKKQYDWKEASASFGVAIGKRLIDAGQAGIAATILFALYEYRLFTIELSGIVPIVALFLTFEFFYYWHHRFSHEVRWLWATHSVHHSPNELNLSVAARLGWTGLLSGSIFFFAPLVLIGFHPIAVFVALASSLFYQIWTHTEIIGKLPRPIEWLFNTPSHHRVHHASNANYLDRNYGGVLIVWDRLFGTFAGEDEKPVYGLTTPLRSYNPIKIALWEWYCMARDALKARNGRELAGYFFGPPGWSPEPLRRMSKLEPHDVFKTGNAKEGDVS